MVYSSPGFPSGNYRQAPILESVANFARNPRRVLVIILVTGFVLRLAWLLYAQPIPVADFADYYNVAAGIIDHGQFGYPQPSAIRLPGWPAVMAVLMLASRSVMWLSMANIVLSMAACGLVYVLALQLTRRPPAALLAAAGVALYPAFIFFSPVLASEQLYSVLLLGALIVILRARQSRQHWQRRALLAGALLGAACLTRGEALILAPLLALLLVHRHDPPQTGNRLTFVPALILLATMAAVLAPWYLRNLNTMGRGAGLSSGTGINFYFAHNPVAYGYHVEPNTPLDDPDEMVRNRAGFEEAMKYIRQDPASLWRTAALGTIGLYSRPDYSLVWSTCLEDRGLGRRPSKPLSLLYYCWRLLAVGWHILAALAALAVLTIRRWGTGGVACVALCLLGNWLCNAAISFGCDRFRYAIDHLLVIAAAMTFVQAVGLLTNLRRPKPAQPR